MDSRLATVTRPDGGAISFSYDGAGRLISVSTPTGAMGYNYDTTTGNLTSAIAKTETIGYQYNGSLHTSSTWTGSIGGSVTRNYDENFWVVSESISNGATVAFQYDNDRLLTQAGSLLITRSSQNGLISATTLGVVADSWTYDGFGDLVGYTAATNGVPLYTVQLARDAAAGSLHEPKLSTARRTRILTVSIQRAA